MTEPDAMPLDLENALKVAKQASQAAEKVIGKYYRQSPEVTLKADASPVTCADVESERAIRAIIGEAFPDHGFYGEETGRSDRDSDFLWLVDPIDGTKSFVREYPFFSTQIALMHRGQMVLGVSNAPEWRQMAWAIRGQGAFLNGQRLSVNPEIPLEQACVSTGNIKSLVENGWDRLGQLLLAAGKTRGYGDFYHYHLLAAGKLDIVVESDVNILDIAALSLIVSEAGGIFTDLQGQPVNLATTSVLAASPALHTVALAYLRPDSPSSTD
jgi:histidinol-phosphatase